MGKNKVGSLKGITVDGFDYDTFADSTANKKPNFTNEVMPTSGDGLVKQVVQVASIEGVTFKVKSVSDRQQLEYSCEKGDGIKIILKYRNGDKDFIIGSFAIDGVEMTDGKATINILPSKPVESQAA
jgi:hypothetical protein